MPRTQHGIGVLAETEAFIRIGDGYASQCADISFPSQERHLASTSEEEQALSP